MESRITFGDRLKMSAALFAGKWDDAKEILGQKLKDLVAKQDPKLWAEYLADKKKRDEEEEAKKDSCKVNNSQNTDSNKTNFDIQLGE